MNTTNATAETPEQWAQRVAQDVLDRDYWGKDRPRLAAELARVKAQADRADAMEEALREIDAATANLNWSSLDWAQIATIEGVMEAVHLALAQTGGQK